MSKKSTAAHAHAHAANLEISEATVAEVAKSEAALAEAEANVQAAFDELVIEGGNPQPFIVGGFFDGLLTRLLATIKFDWHKISASELKAAIKAFGDGAISMSKHLGSAIKPAVDILGGVDDIAIDKAVELEVKLIESMIAMALAQVDALFPNNGPFMARPPMTAQDAQDWIDGFAQDELARGVPVTLHNAECVEKIRAKPEVVRVLKRLSKSRQQKALTDPTFLDKILAFWEKYGSFILSILSFLIL